MFTAASQRVRLFSHPVQPLLRWPERIDAGDGLGLRRASDADMRWMQHAVRDADITRFTGIPKATNAGSTRRFLRATDPRARAPEDIFFLIARDGQRLGGAGLHFRWPRGWEIGYWMARSARGAGDMRRAVTALVGEAFGRGLVPSLFIQCCTDNHASASIILGLGAEEQTPSFSSAMRVAHRMPVRRFVLTPERFEARGS